jgi:hypothetical protein
MIGAPKANRNNFDAAPSPSGMLKILIDRGFKSEHSALASNAHFEDYW